MRSSRFHLELGRIAELAVLALFFAGACKAAVSDTNETGGTGAMEPDTVDPSGEAAGEDPGAAGAAGEGAAGDEASAGTVAPPPFDADGGAPPPIVASTNPIDIQIEWSDARIADVLTQVLVTSIQRVELAASAAEDQAVRDFASATLTDLNTTKSQLDVVLTQVGVVAETNAVSDEIASRTSATMAELQGLSGSAFDAAFLEAQVALDADVYAFIGAQIMPAAEGGQLSVGATAIRAAVRRSMNGASTLLDTVPFGG